MRRTLEVGEVAHERREVEHAIGGKRKRGPQPSQFRRAQIDVAPKGIVFKSMF